MFGMSSRVTGTLFRQGKDLLLRFEGGQARIHFFDIERLKLKEGLQASGVIFLYEDGSTPMIQPGSVVMTKEA